MARRILRLNIYEYEDYRRFLREAFSDLQSRDKSVTYRHFSKVTGLRSPAFLKLVIDGQRNLTEKSLERVADFFELTKEESSFFKSLVFLNQATTLDKKQFYAQQVLKSRGYRKVNPLAESQYNYFSKWYYLAIRELVGIPGFQNDPQWISKRFGGLFSPKEAEVAIEQLQKLGLIFKAPNGKLAQAQAAIVTPDEVSSTVIAQFHKNMILLAGDSIQRFPREVREISAVTFSLSRKSIQSIKELMQRFRHELETILDEETEQEGVFQVNFQFFPLALPEEQD